MEFEIFSIRPLYVRYNSTSFIVNIVNKEFNAKVKAKETHAFNIDAEELNSGC